MSVLDKRFDELRDEGFIYNEPNEKGQDMSYGEYAAVAQDLEDTLKEYLADRPFEEIPSALREALNCSDDVRIFVDLEPYESFLENLYEEEINDEYYYKIDGNLSDYPEALVEAYEQYRENVPEPYEEEELY